MSTEEAETKPDGGGPAHQFGNRVAWSWSREMPRYLKGGFLTALYAMRSMSSANGKLCFKDGKPIRIQDLAKAFGCREQDARRYLEAAIRARLVLVDGVRRRGVPTMYVLNPLIRFPEWDAAVQYLKGTARQRQEAEAAEEGSSHGGTNPSEEGSGHGGTNSEGEVRATEARTDAEAVRSTVDRPGSVHRGTNGSVHSGPNIPGVNHGFPHDMADVVTQPEVVGGSAAETDESSQVFEDAEFGRCEVCKQPLLRPGMTRCSVHREPVPGHRRRRREYPTQPPLMAVVPDAPEEPAGRPSFAWEPEDPLAPQRLCGCGRTHRSRTEGPCQDCQFAARQEAETA